MKIINIISVGVAVALVSSCGYIQTYQEEFTEKSENYSASGEYEKDGAEDTLSNVSDLENGADSSELPKLEEIPQKAKNAKEFFANALFVGDAVMLGFSKYLSTTENSGVISSDQIYGIGSYSVYHSLHPEGEDAVGPEYDGELVTTEDLCRAEKADSVYLLLGTNDIALFGVDNTFEGYKELISRIREKNPGIRCYVLSVCRIARGGEKTVLNNDNIRELNSLLEKYCLSTMQAEYINISDALITRDGYLADKYSSDGFIHQNNDAYAVWENIFRNFAANKIDPTKNIPLYEVNTETTSLAQKDTETIAPKHISADKKHFYDDAVFVGDSLVVGFSEYLHNFSNNFYGDPQFIARISLGTYHALMPLYETDLHPTYNGRRMRVPDAVAACGAKKVFVSFGINDLNAHSPQKAFEDYKELLNEIKEKSPSITFYILSTTNIVSGSENNYLTNKNVRKLNSYLREYCSDNGIPFIDTASRLVDGNGALARKYSSDGYVHQNSEAYKVWVSVLNDFAEEQ